MEKDKLCVHLDFSNVMAENLGAAHGLSKAVLDNYQSQVTTIHHDFLRRRETGEFAFMNLPAQKEILDEIDKFLDPIQGRFENYVHLGIGGSALGPLALHSALRNPFYNLLSPQDRNSSPKMFFLDNIDPDTIAALSNVLDISKTLFAVVTKSGGTSETIASFLIFFEKLRDRLGDKYRDNLVLITDPLRGFLREFANQKNIANFSIDPAIGGRFSVLTPVGLLPAAISGIDVNLLLDGANFMTKICQREDLFENPAYMFGLINYLYYLEGKPTSVMMSYSDQLFRITDWFRQLWAESLGKKKNRTGDVINIGPLPVNALGVTDQHSQVQLYMEGPNDKIFSFLEVEKFERTVVIKSSFFDSDETGYLNNKSINQLIKTEKQATEIALTNNQRPNLTFKVPAVNPFTLGQLFQIFEIATAFTGELFGINAFDQPGVEAGKIATYALMNRPGYERKAEEIEKKLSGKQQFLI